MLSKYSGKKGFIGAFGEIWRIQIRMHPQTSIEPKYGAFHLKNEVGAHGLVLLVQLSGRVYFLYLTRRSCQANYPFSKMSSSMPLGQDQPVLYKLIPLNN